MSLSIFLPVRKGSERVESKNTRNFAGIEGGLLKLKLQQLIQVELVDEIVVSTNDEKCIEIVREFQSKVQKLTLNERPNSLCNSSTKLSDLIEYAGSIISTENILWTHVTSPLCRTSSYIDSIIKYQEIKKDGFDSLISGRKYQEFLLDTNTFQMVNNKTNVEWPRTQDLVPLFEINNAVFIASRENYLQGRRTGNQPFLMELDKISSIDIDDTEDFFIAQAIYERTVAS